MFGMRTAELLRRHHVTSQQVVVPQLRGYLQSVWIEDFAMNCFIVIRDFGQLRKVVVLHVSQIEWN